MIVFVYYINLLHITSAVQNSNFNFETKRYEIKPKQFRNSIRNSKLNIIINHNDY